MKSNKCAVLMFNKKGNCYQVALKEAEEKAVISVISFYHNGHINCLKEKLAIERVDKKKDKKNV